LSLATFDRATRLAKTLFDCAESVITLVKDGVVWRSRDPEGRLAQGHTGTNLVLERGDLVWIEDALLDPRVADDPFVIGPTGVRSFVGVPINLADGTVPGALCIVDTKVQPYSARKAARLRDLADFVADEWARANAAKAREQASQEREALLARLNGIVRALPVSLVITDKTFCVIGCSPLWAKDVGRSQDEVIGRSLQELTPKAFEQWRGYFDQVVSGETFSLDRLRTNATDGSEAWAAVEMAPWIGLDGSVGGMIVSTHDLTSMVVALENAARSEQRLKLAMEIADVHVWEMDYVNRTLTTVGHEERFFTHHMTYDEVYTDAFCGVAACDRDAVVAAWSAHSHDGSPFRVEHRVARADDREVWASLAALLVTNDAGVPIRLVGALQNVTERKDAERALRQAKEQAEIASRAKSAFLATMSHEIRTPLNGVLGMAQAMAADDLTPIQHARLSIVRQSGETLLTILNDILDLSKIEAGKLELEDVDFDLGKLGQSARQAFAAVARQKGVALRLDLDPAARGAYRGDSTRILQILHNLISNALKFTASGEVRLSIAATPAGLKFQVSDTGIGLAPEGLDKLFQKFEQVDASTTRRYGGTGLGLAICRELAQALGGEISVVSALGEGTTFTVVIPLTRIGDEADLPQEPPGEDRALDPDPGLRVLAAEDNSVNQLVLKTLLNQAGVDPFIVSDGAEAIEAWRTREWDVILMDVQMPVLDGPSAAAEIRRLEAETGRARTPIIALTANAMAHQIPDYLAAGMDGFVAKPINVAHLFAALDAATAPVQNQNAAA